MARRHVRILAAALLASAGAAAWAQGAAEPSTPREDAVRAEFRAALDAVAQPKRAADSAALRAYLLYPYLEAARLRQRLVTARAGTRDAALEKHAQEFLARHGAEPVARELRSQWLGYLGERKAWALFLEQAPPVLTDTALRCHALARAGR